MMKTGQIRRSPPVHALALAMLCSTSAAAQTAPAGAAAAGPSAATPAPAPVGVQEVVVTAQRRAENVQKAALSIAVLTSNQLAQLGVTNAQSLNNIVPGLKIAYTGAQVQTFIRGVGDVSANAFTQSSVSLNTDGVYLARSSAFGPLFFDTARVEVLRGPQGTLYGRNSSGGAINVISNAPSLTQFGGYIVGETGNYDLYRLQGAVNLPVSDTFALRAAVQVTHRDGYLSDGADDDKSAAVRLRALWEPTPNLTISPIVEYGHVGGEGFNRVYRPELFGDPWTGPNDPRITPALFPSLRVRNDNSQDTNYTGASTQIDYKFGGATLTVLPAFKAVNVGGDLGQDYLFAEYDHSKEYSLEARLSGNAYGLKWVVGAYGFKEDLNVFIVNDQRSDATLTGAYQLQDIPDFNTGAWAVFGEGTYSLTSRLRLIGGLRYTQETRTRNGQILNTPYVDGVAGATTSVNFVNQSETTGAVTWRTGLEYDLTPADMLYFTVSRGFKSGGYDATDPDPYKPEYVTAYTLGSKNRFLSNTLQVNLEGFYWQYEDQQVAFLGVDDAGLTSFITRNAGQSTIYGLDTDVIWRPTRADTLTGGVEYLHTDYDNFRYTTVGVFAAGAALPDGCVSGGAVPNQGAPLYVENCSGNPLPRAPEWTVNARYTHAFDLGHNDDITLGATFAYNSLSYLGPNYADPNFAQKAYELYNADITYNAPGGRWSFQGYVRNIANTPVYETASTVQSIQPTSGINRTSIDAIDAPRTYGARLQLNF